MSIAVLKNMDIFNLDVILSVLETWGFSRFVFKVAMFLRKSFIDNWPPTLKTQLSHSGSHLELLALLGETKSFIGIFEIFSRTPLPQGTKQIMFRIPSYGHQDIDKKLVSSSLPSSSLAGYSLVVASKAADAIPDVDRNVNNIRRLIHECMHEALKFDQLIHDITAAARGLARLNSSKELQKGKENEARQPMISLKSDFSFESLTDRPQDWRSSHWWTGE